MERLLDRLNADLKQAMLARDTLRTSVLRMLLTRVKEKQSEIGVQRTASEEEIQQVLTAFAKQRREAAEVFLQGGRRDLHDKELRERDIVLSYLPEMLDDAAIRAALEEIIAELGASTARDLGRVMRTAMQRLQARAEGARVQALARELLGA